jgi:hypothetical protein
LPFCSVWYVFTSQFFSHSVNVHEVDGSPTIITRSQSVESSVDTEDLDTNDEAPFAGDNGSHAEDDESSNEAAECLSIVMESSGSAVETLTEGSAFEDEDLFGEGSGADPEEFEDAVSTQHGSEGNGAGT